MSGEDAKPAVSYSIQLHIDLLDAIDDEFQHATQIVVWMNLDSTVMCCISSGSRQSTNIALPPPAPWVLISIRYLLRRSDEPDTRIENRSVGMVYFSLQNIFGPL